MEMDEENIDDAVFALLWLTLHDGIGPGRVSTGPARRNPSF
ncbi:hypothetical protein JOH51_002457 [Rhizobium leguminosarum]|nr:hypothetical protein [Rhizobium leguminosarum]